MKKTDFKPRKIKNWLGVCVVCRKDKSQTNFGSGRSGECNSCAKRRWNSENSLKVRSQRLYGNAQKRAKARGWPAPDFDCLWIEEKILQGFCEATGIKFDLESVTSKSVHAKNPWVPSLDRIDSRKPYLKENVQVVVYMYNVCKSDFSHADVIAFCKAVSSMEQGIG